MTKRAVLYARVSGDDRSKEGRNLKGQLEMCRDYALSKGYVIIAELAEDDRGACGADLDLEELTQALSMARNDEFDVLVVRELDRFARTLAKQLIVETELQQADVRVEYVIEQYDDTPEGILRKNIRATIAEYERQKIAERTKRAKRRKAKEGHVVAAARIPYGYRLAEVDGKKALEPHEPGARVIRLIFDWYTGNSGEPKSTRAIAKSLEDMGIPTWGDLHPGKTVKKKARNVWSNSSVQVILKNPVYVGDWHYADIPMSVPPIVSRDTWEAAQEYRKKNRINAMRNRKYDYLLAGRAKCRKCGASMRGITSMHGSERKKRTRYHYYLCYSRQDKNYRRECDVTRFRVDWVDPVVWDKVREWLDDPFRLECSWAEYQKNQEKELAPIRERVKVIDELLAENRGKLERLIDLYLTGDVDKDLLVGRKRRIEETIRSLEGERARQIARLEAQALTDGQKQDIERFTEIVKAGLASAKVSFEAKRRVLDLLDLQAEFFIEDGVKKVKIVGILGLDAVLSVVNTSS